MQQQNQLPSNQSFGALFVFVFSVLAAWQGWRGAQGLMFLWLGLAIITAGVTLLRPVWLTPLNRAWMTLGHLLGHIVSPVVLGMMYAVLIVPVGLIMRIVGRDIMHRRFTPDASYWQERTDGAMSTERFKNQF